MLKLNQQVRDVVTGFEGVTTSKVEYINGCVQFGVQSKCVDGKLPEPSYFDFQRLTIIGDGEPMPSREGGGEMRGAPATTYRG